MSGPMPKHPSMRQRRNRTTTASSLVDTNPIANEMPGLPRRRNAKGQFIGWRPEVKAWWKDLWASPMALEYVQADIHGLFMLADLLDRYWRNPTAALATEIRLQRQCFGLTPIDRRRLQWEVQRVERPRYTQQQAHETTSQSKHKDPRSALRVVK